MLSLSAGRRAPAWRAGLVILTCGLAVGFSNHASAQVQWRSGAGAAPVRQARPALQESIAALAARPEHKRVVAHFDSALDPAQKANLQAAGLTLLDYLGSHAYFATIDAKADPGAIAAFGSLLTVEPILDAWKLHPDFNAGLIRSFFIVDGLDQPIAAGDAVTRDQLQAQGADPIVAAAVALHRDADVSANSNRLVRLGARIVHQYQTIKGFDIEIPLSKLYALAGDDDIRWIEPPLPPLAECNDSNRALTGVDMVNDAPYNLNGEGIDVLVYDSGGIANHPALTGRVTSGDGANPVTHSTHVAGTIGGTGAGSSNNIHRGMAPGVRFLSYAVGGFTQGYFRHLLGDTEMDYLDGISRGADLANNSVGSNTATNNWPCEYHGDYGLFNEMLDTLIRGERVGQDGTPFRTIWAAGNERQSSRCSTTPGEPQGSLGFYSCAPPQPGKNQVCVGAVNSNNDSITTFTSFGPTDDGRLKPDFCAPGCQSGGDNGVTSCNTSGGYSSLCGTSMASPTATGIAALFLQDWRDIYSGQPDPRNSTIKTIFAHTAIDIDDPGPDYRTGFGSIRAPRIIDHLRSGNFLEAEVDHGQNYSFIVVVNPGDAELKVTVAWDDFRGTANVNPNLVNDLDVVVHSPSGVRHFPWTLNPAIPDDPAVQNAENHLDNIEQVYVANPEVGAWTVEIRGTNVPEGPQVFSAAASPVLVNCSDAGMASFGEAGYSCSAPSARVRVVDCGLNTSNKVVDAVMVVVSSTSDPSGELVMLTEVSPEAAAFVADVPLSTDGAPGTVRISPNDTLTITYIDADDGNGNTNVMVTATAFIDCTPPTISDVLVGNIGPRSAEVSFSADEPVTAVVNFGVACDDLTGSAGATSARAAHTVTLTPLLDDTNYYFSITATDEVGNSATFDNSGECFAFGTPDVPDYFTEEFDAGDNDLDFRQLTLTPNGSVDFYHACVLPAETYGTDPAGGTRLTLPNNGFVAVNLLDGARVSLYGVEHSTVFVGSNGYVTFGSGSSDATETLAEHFDIPRISLCYTDLDPAAGGEVSWRQLEDRLVVTWDRVPERSQSNQNSFQVEMFFDGTIRCTWLGIGVTDGIVGLSRGTDIPSDYYETDITGLAAGCIPAPPRAANGIASCFTGTGVNITLSATDDGRPNGTIDYIITALPEHGRLVDPSMGVISSVPYMLPNHSRVVRYHPLGLYTGADDFNFVATDGGTPPDGGESNVAVVTVNITSNEADPIYQFLVNDANPNWAYAGGQNGWGFGVPRGKGSHNGDPTSGFTGQNVIGYNLGGDYQNSLFPSIYTTSPPMNLTGHSNTMLRFRRWLGIDAANFDRAAIQLSTNGTTWTNVWVHTGEAIEETSWSLQVYDISALADNRPSVQIRFGMGPTNATLTYPGWNLDDIEIIGRVDIVQCPCDWNATGDLNSQDLFDFLTGFFANEADYNADGQTNSQDFFDFLACFFGGCV